MLHSSDNKPDINTLINKAVALEGNFSDYPTDQSGLTWRGFTEAVALAHGYSGNMHYFLREEAMAIYKHQCWLRPNFDQIAGHAPDNAAKLFVAGINMATRTAIGFFQRAECAQPDPVNLARTGFSYNSVKFVKNGGTLQTLS